jgi:hypothetical protein
MPDTTVFDVTTLHVHELETNMVDARHSAVELAAAGDYESAALYAARMDLMLDEWTRRRAA